MPAEVHFAVLAHNKPDCVLDLVDSLREAAPGSGVSVFNGGTTPEFLLGADVELCPRSRPLRYGNLSPFHFAVMRWLVERRDPFDVLVTVDQDVLPLRNDLSRWLGDITADHGYRGVRFGPLVERDLEAGAGTFDHLIPPVRHRWRNLLGVDEVHWSFNPGQVIRRDAVDLLLRHPNLEEIERIAYRSHVWAMEEILIPSMCVGLGVPSAPLPGGEGMRYAFQSPQEMAVHAEDPDVHLVHRVTMDLQAADRIAVHALRRGEGLPDGLSSAAATADPVPGPEPSRRTLRGINRRVQRRRHRLHRRWIG